MTLSSWWPRSPRRGKIDHLPLGGRWPGPKLPQGPRNLDAPTPSASLAQGRDMPSQKVRLPKMRFRDNYILQFYFVFLNVWNFITKKPHAQKVRLPKMRFRDNCILHFIVVIAHVVAPWAPLTKSSSVTGKNAHINNLYKAPSTRFWHNVI